MPGGKVDTSETGGSLTTDLSGQAERQFEEIRRTLAERRRELGISMSELARRVGVSPSMVSQMERGQTLPSVATLFALGAALGATVDMFFTEPSTPEATRPRSSSSPSTKQPTTAAAESREQLYVVRGGSRARIEIKGGVHWERLTPTSLGNAEFLELNYEPHAESDPNLYRHPGIELVMVLEGRFDIYIGFDRYELHPSDSITFPSSLPHRYVNPTDSASRAVTFILRESLGAAEFGGEGDPENVVLERLDANAP